MSRNIIIALLLSFQIVSCQERKVELTPDEFISKVEVPSELYLKDSFELKELISIDIKEHKGGYSSKIYDEYTGIVIDTIMYSPDYEKLVFFVINKIENKKTYLDNISQSEIKAIEKQTKLAYNGYSYEGKTYVGIRDNNLLRVEFLGMTIGKFKEEELNKLRKRQRQIFFEEYATVNEKGYEYNIDDIRFWDNVNFWDNIRQKEEKRKRFEETKKNNPENVYDPNDRK